MWRLSLVLLSLLVLTACAHPHLERIGKVDNIEPDALLTVQAEGKIEVPPDQLQMRLSVVTTDADSDAAMAENNRRMNALITTLELLGLDKTDYRTGQFRTEPEWSRPPRPAPANWQRSIVGYTVRNELRIRTYQVNLAGRLLAAAQMAEVNQIGGLNFVLAEPEDHRQQAIALATRRAMRKAETLAEAAGVRLGELRSLTLDQAAAPGPYPRMEMLATRAVAADEVVPVHPGSVEVRAGVTLVYRVLPGS